MAKNNKTVYLVSAVIIIIAVAVTFFLTNQFHITKFKEYDANIQQQLNEESLKVTDLNSEKETLQNQINTLKEDNIDFTKEYSIVLNNIHMAINYLTSSAGNLDYGNYYVQTGDYTYASAVIYHEIGGQQALNSKALLEQAEEKLKNIKDKSPNDFFERDVVNRLNQTKTLFDVANNLFWLNYYAEKELYEVNYGTIKSEATQWHNNYNDMIPYYNINTKKMNDIHNKIDLQWDRDWYPNYEGQ